MTEQQPTKVWVIEVPDSYEDNRFDVWEPDLDYGVFLSEESAQECADEINEKRLTYWISEKTEDHWRFDQRVTEWKVENFDKAPEERSPMPERRVPKPEDFPDRQKARILAVEVTP